MYDFMEALRQRQGVGVAALQFTILTAARSADTIGARWDEIELKAIPVTTRDADGNETIIKGPCWVIPAHRMKRPKPHVVPLSDRAVEILKAMPREDSNPFVFIGASKGKPISAMAMPEALERMAWPTAVTVHGMRSSFRDWASEIATFPKDVVETALHHTVGNAVERAYRRGEFFDKRRLLMDAWAKWCTTPRSSPGEVVVPIKGRK
jgi:integrase